MFQTPHDVQAVFEVKLTGASRAPADLSDRLYTFVPERLSLDALRTGSLRSFRGTIHLGNFEQDGPPIVQGVTVQLVKVVHEHLLAANAPEADAGEPDYIRFGAPGKEFAVHRIGRAPSFDRILKVAADGTELEISCLQGPEFTDSCER